jgi:hypothetical protein
MNKQIQTMLTLSVSTLLLSSVASSDLQGVSIDSMDTGFVTPDDTQVFEVDGRVLIGQFTTDGDITGEINILGKNADLTSWQYSSVALPAPGAIAILGIAGYCGIRRRR